MKAKLVFAAALTGAIALSPAAHAQAWHDGAKVFSFGMGGSSFIHFGKNYIYHNEIYYHGNFSRRTGQINIQGEFAVHKYVGVGFTTGFGFSGGGYRSYYDGEINFPFGAIANFHFWQLVDDRVSSNMHARELDMYGGLNIGTGFAVMSKTYSDGSDVLAIMFIGPQLGVRYYFNDFFGVNAEVGYGKSWINAGVVLKPY